MIQVVESNKLLSLPMTDYRKKRRDFLFQKLDQRWFHELVVIRNVKAHDSFAFELSLELRRQLVLMSFLHDEN